MPLELSVGPQSSNKPAAPVPTPAKSEFPTKIDFHDGRSVWVSVPFPDRLTLIGHLTADLFSPPPKGAADEEETLRTWSQFIAQGEGKTTASVLKLDHKKKILKEILLTVDANGATVHVGLKPPTTAVPRWRLRLEFNPRRLGPDGFAALAMDLRFANTFDLDKFLAHARCTRLDAAVDFINLGPWETVLHSKIAGKRVNYIGEDGELETVQLHKPSPPAKQVLDPAGTVVGVKLPRSRLGIVHAKLYDRVKERAGVLKNPPFAGVPITRFEVVRIWKGNGPLLTSLPAFPDPFEPYSLSYVGYEQIQDDGAWRTYVSARRSRPAGSAADDMGLGPKRRLDFARWMRASESSLLRHKVSWDFWPDGLAATGLGKWITLANKAAI